MTREEPNTSNLAEVLDRILDKGIVIDLWARIAVVGLELITVEARVVVASIDTFLHYCAEIGAIQAGEIEAEDVPTDAPRRGAAVSA
ncbi:gas vesicle protein GvpA [Haladaptatus pallidirubidus]|uniref:Gas vesicle structural protein GvpA n=1 Tax=Haladaptatus pallidirubidus TaxID=1008152 RepID=A0AAV3UD84_9EURY|nr:gas vesicle structural protein GvpA [Haladaptatus pallidirubidus]